MVVEGDSHICWSVDFIAVTLLTNVEENTFRVPLVTVNDLLKSNSNYCHVP
jgi:hypothetical protein